MTLPIDFEVGDTNHTGAHNDTNTAVNSVTARVTALEDAPPSGVTTGEVNTAVAAGVTAHVNAADPHALYLKQDEGDARYILQSVADTFATDTELTAGLATKAPTGDVVSLNSRVNDLEDAPPAHTHTIADIVAAGTRDDTTFLRGDGTFAAPPDAGGGGVTDHGALTGLADDDHTQYHTDARGDARYYTKAQVDTTTGGLTPTSRTVTAGTGLTGGGSLAADRSFAVAYGTVTGTAAQGNDSRIVAAAPRTQALAYSIIFGS